MWRNDKIKAKSKINFQHPPSPAPEPPHPPSPKKQPTPELLQPPKLLPSLSTQDTPKTSTPQTARRKVTKSKGKFKELVKELSTGGKEKEGSKRKKHTWTWTLEVKDIFNDEAPVSGKRAKKAPRKLDI